MTVARKRLAVLLVLAAVGGTTVGVVAHVAYGEPDRAGPALPDFHGQASWAPGERAAPPFRLRNQDGKAVSLAGLRGRPVLVTFLDSRCVEQCPVTGHQLGTVLRRMDAADRPALVIVSVNPRGDTRASIHRAMTDWGLAGPWRWHWLRGTRAELSRVWAAYGITVQPTTNDITHGLALYLVDRRGFQRTGYLFPFLPNFVGLDLVKLARAEEA
jgi:cytochrome oxidase Cu insertion factor (SCO1/SenC/PrrC family)